MLHQLERKTFGNSMYQKAYQYRNDSNFIDYLADDFADEFEDNPEDLNKTIDALYELVKDVKYYQDLIELDDEPVYDLIPPKNATVEQISDLNNYAEMVLDDVIKEFVKITGVNITLEGRSNRHVCVENSLLNALNYSTMKTIQQRLRAEYINKVTQFINNGFKIWQIYDII